MFAVIIPGEGVTNGLTLIELYIEYLPRLAAAHTPREASAEVEQLC